MIERQHLVTIGEVHTGLLQNSIAVSARSASELLSLVMGQRVRRSDRPIAHAVSPETISGVDCPILGTGRRVRGIGTVTARAVLTGGHIVQGSAHARVVRGEGTHRQPWSYYLTNPGQIETISGRGDGDLLADGFLGPAHRDGIDLASIAARTMDAVQDRPELDRRASFRTSRTRLRWAFSAGDRSTMTFTVENEVSRTLRLPSITAETADLADFCEDLALHDWLLTTLLSLIERTRLGSASRAEAIERLRPAIDHLLHLWMPAARTEHGLAELWRGLERRPGFTRQWQVNVDRIRDQLALAGMERQGR
ncbi:hypothetical protein F4553_005095 [Allocatelliglobosispora scoriae]|uniref:Uncharacterized protein n=1 Tax=Allocatelliglobosispora scoriae TaxID=643052 RepID=A0A841BW46_9ACTN|nr:SCO2521 family protein [Allocatelliglobosispora scoriae]MBB5871716.1 hypothetical protein [Allocatelliglobosispora scoriae]